MQLIREQTLITLFWGQTQVFLNDECKIETSTKKAGGSSHRPSPYNGGRERKVSMTNRQNSHSNEKESRAEKYPKYAHYYRVGEDLEAEWK